MCNFGRSDLEYFSKEWKENLKKETYFHIDQLPRPFFKSFKEELNKAFKKTLKEEKMF